MSVTKSHITVKCLERLLRPLIRFCVKNSLSLRDVVETSKVLFVEIAASEIEKSGERITTSRISVMTGVHRKDVQRIKVDGGEIAAKPSFITRIIAHWQTNSSFLTKGGKPRVLSFDGENSDFWALVRSVSKELNPATILYELERRGLTAETRGGIKLIYDFEPFGDDPEADFEHLGKDTEDLLRAVQENMSEASTVPNLHLRTEYDNIFIEDLPHIRKWVLEQGTMFHRKVRSYLAKYDQDLSPKKNRTAGAKVVVGAFSRIESGDQS